jgi:hypothetical protein
LIVHATFPSTAQRVRLARHNLAAESCRVAVSRLDHRCVDADASPEEEIQIGGAGAGGQAVKTLLVACKSFLEAMRFLGPRHGRDLQALWRLSRCQMHLAVADADADSAGGIPGGLFSSCIIQGR